MSIEEIENAIEQVLIMLEEKKPAQISAYFALLHPVDIAEIIENEELDTRQKSILFRLLPKNIAAEVFVEMDSEMQEHFIQGFNDNELKQMLAELFVDDTVDIIEEMPANVVRRIIQNCSAEMRADINSILSYPSDSAGSIMTPEYIALRREMTVEEAFAYIRKVGLDSETVYTCYVVEKDRTLSGVATVRQLLLSKKDALVGDVMEPNVVFVETSMDREEAAKLFAHYDFLAFPVVDKETRLVGIITVDDAIDVIREETTEDFSKMAAVVPIEQTYFKTGVFAHASSRIVWLIVLLLSATVTGAIITFYEEAFAAVPMLIACLPMLMGTGGNCGAQASTMVIRAMAIDEMRPKDIFKALWKEIRIALLVGVVLAIVNTVMVIVIQGIGPDTMRLALTTGLALLFTTCLAQSLGCALPMAAKACKLDPAIMASPLITTIVDAVSVMVFFAIAVVIFGL
ncbi:MAG: magnesium transporter [Clostridia bacterium]|nr:magnesium transporter [Clostridia bacterium]